MPPEERHKPIRSSSRRLRRGTLLTNRIASGKSETRREQEAKVERRKQKTVAPISTGLNCSSHASTGLAAPP